MSESTRCDSASLPNRTRQSEVFSSWPFTFLLSILCPVLVATLVYELDSFDPAPLPLYELTQPPMAAPEINDAMLKGSELVGSGQLLGPEDIEYDSASKLIYTGCLDGWIKRVTVNESVAETVVENWVNTGGRPLGLARGPNNELIVADADKGLLKISKSGEIEVLTDEAESVKCKITDGVVVAEDGIIYFTDASYKYASKEFAFDVFEGRPHGRLLSFDPMTKHTQVLLRHLYFANGVSLSPRQDFVIFCETIMKRCRKYYIKGEKKGHVEKFADNLPGLPDNIRYDGQGHYWIGLATGVTNSWDMMLRYPWIRKVAAILEKYKIRLKMEENAGVMVVDSEGKPVAHYYDPRMSMVTAGFKIADYLYCGSSTHPYLVRLNISEYPATVAP